MAKAFEGVRIVELAQVIAGPFATAMLGFLGAEIIKVEPPRGGDQARRLMDTGPLGEAGQSPLFQGLNPGKRSVTIDLKHPGAREIVNRLVEQADVVIENSRPGSIARLGYGYEEMRAVRPDIIYCSISGYGQSGPRRADPAYDGAVQAASGMMSVTGNEGDGPMKAGFTVIDNSTALTAAFAISSALYRRAMTGEGQCLDVSMFDTALSLLSPLITNYLIGGQEPAQVGNHSLTRQPTGNVFPTREGYLQVNAVTDAQVRAFCTTIGRPGLPDDPRFATMSLRLEHSDEMHAEFVAALASRTAAEWETTLAAAGVTAARVLSIPEALRDPLVAHRDILQTVPAPAGMEGPPSTVVNVGFRANVDGPGVEVAAPILGQHTDAILAEIGYTADDIARFREAGIV